MPSCKPRSLSAWLVILAGVLVVFLAACGGGDDSGPSGGGVSDEAQIRNNMDRMISALRSQDLRTLYRLAAPEAREICSEDEFVLRNTGATPAGGRRWDKFGIRVTSVEVHGDTAEVTGVVTYDGTDASDSFTDTWAKIDGHWYVDPEGTDECSI